MRRISTENTRLNPPSLRRILALGTLALTLTLAISSCDARKRVLAPVVVPDQGPTASSPALAVKRLAWTLVKRQATSYIQLFTDDYRFEFAANDSAGNPYRDPGAFDLACETAAAQHMLVGGGIPPAAAALELVMDNPLIAQVDPRPGMDPYWHRALRTTVSLKLTVDNNGTPDVSSISGYALFYLVRGDSAYFLPSRSAARDSTRWYISRWEDETVGASGIPAFAAQPTRTPTLGSIKALYVATAAAPR